MTHVYYYYCAGPKDSDGTGYPNYSALGYMNYTGFRWTGATVESLEDGMEIDLGSARVPQPGQMMLVRLIYTQNDVSYGSQGYSSMDGQQISVYMPMTNAGVGESDAEPYFNYYDDGSDTYAIGSLSLNGSEEYNISIKYGGLSGYMTAKSVIYDQLAGPNGIVTEMYTSLISREVIPNVIRTNMKQTADLGALGDEANIRASNFSISTTGTSTTSY